MRKKLLVKPILQFKHLMLTLVVVLVSFVACYVLFEYQVQEAVRRAALDQTGWLVLRHSLRFGFACTLVLLLIGIGLENYFFFHTIAGPIYALEKGLKRLSEGDFVGVTRIRDTDQLGDLITAFEDMKKKILFRIEKHEKTAQILAQEVERLLANTTPENISSSRKRLQELLAQAETKAA